jgi:hypothetical protein
MSEKNDEARREQQRLARVLAGIEKTAREASLTGQLAGGQAIAIRQYNAILERLERADAVPAGIFAPLPETAAFDEVGVAASSLAQYLRGDDEEGESRRRWREGGGVFEATPHHVKIVGFPGNISDLGGMLREYLPDFLRQRVDEAITGVPQPPEPPIPPTPPIPPAPPPPRGARFEVGFGSGGAGGAWHWSGGPGAPPPSPPPPPGGGPTDWTETHVRTETQTTTERQSDLAAEITEADRHIAELTAQLRDPNTDPGMMAVAARELAEAAQRRAMLEQRREPDGSVEV